MGASCCSNGNAGHGVARNRGPWHGTNICLLTLFLVMVASTDAHSGRTSATASKNIRSGKYPHTDHETHVELMCDKCPAGTYVSKHCTATDLRECSSCPGGTFTEHETGAEKCRACKLCTLPQMERMACTALSDRECTCPPGAFLVNETCVPHSVCPVGSGVRRKGSETEDVRCKPCTHGTFSDVPSSVLRCKVHTNCLELGLKVIQPGTKEKDHLCGPLSTNPTNASRAVPPTTFPLQGVTYSGSSIASLRPNVSDNATEPTAVNNDTLKNKTDDASMGVSITTEPRHQQNNHHHKKHTYTVGVSLQPGGGVTGQDGAKSTAFKTTKRGQPRQHMHRHFDINEHLPWMIVLFLLLVLVVIVVCSVRRSSRTLKKGPRQDPSSIVEKAGLKNCTTLAQNREKWVYYCNGHGVDILKLVAAQVGSQWQDIYQFLCNASEREMAAFSNGYTADHERAYAALQHWTIRGPEVSLAKLISALRQHRRNDVVEKIRGLMEDNAQLEVETPALPMNSTQPCLSPAPRAKPTDPTVLTVEPSPLEKNKGFFVDESEPLLRCDSTSSGSSALSRTGSFITKEKKDTVLRQVRLDPCDLQPIFDDMLHILNPEELHVIEAIPQAEDKLDRLFEIAGVKSQEASQTLLDSVYCHLPDLL
ncbi:tumor necrosis factor receptor superfamily member 21 [Ambystoma mexicanum]|uniref:tumor necrosis factor receptor superfamily member 21 n=1 Tax=Ambystoma mexicanum TaxID=8296 RepID=UPI0037E91828